MYPLHKFSVLVFRAFDEDSDSYINLSEWIHGLSIFLRGDLTERAKCKYGIQSLPLKFVVQNLKLGSNKVLPS